MKTMFPVPQKRLAPGSKSRLKSKTEPGSIDRIMKIDENHQNNGKNYSGKEDDNYWKTMNMIERRMKAIGKMMKKVET